MRLLIDFLGVGRCSSLSRGCCGDIPERDEREVRFVRRGEEADWRKAKEDEGRRAEFGVGVAFGKVGDGKAAALGRRSCERDMRFMLVLKSSGSVLCVAWEATDGDRVEAGDLGGRSMVTLPRSKRGRFQEVLFSEDVCA
jgi:hypothetical protein